MKGARCLHALYPRTSRSGCGFPLLTSHSEPTLLPVSPCITPTRKRLLRSSSAGKETGARAQPHTLGGFRWNPEKEGSPEPLDCGAPESSGARSPCDAAAPQKPAQRLRAPSERNAAEPRPLPLRRAQLGRACPADPAVPAACPQRRLSRGARTTSRSGRRSGGREGPAPGPR